MSKNTKINYYNENNNNKISNFNASIFNNPSNSNSFNNKIFERNSKQEQHVFVNNLGIRDYLRYINRKNNLKQSSDSLAANNSLFDYNNQENYRSKSTNRENKQKELFTDSIKSKIENTNGDVIEKARGDNKNKIKNNELNKEKNNNNNKENIKMLLTKEEKKDEDFKDVENDIFSDDDYKFIELSKSQRRKLRKEKEQSLVSSGFSLNENNVDYPTAHFNVTKSNIDVSRNGFNVNNKNINTINITEENKEQMFLRFYEDQFNKLPNAMSNNNKVNNTYNNLNNNKNIKISCNNNNENIFEENLLNRENTLFDNTRSAKINNNEFEKSYYDKNKNQKNIKLNFLDAKAVKLTGDTEADGIEGLVKSKGTITKNFETPYNKVEFDSKDKTNANFTDTFGNCLCFLNFLFACLFLNYFYYFQKLI